MRWNGSAWKAVPSPRASGVLEGVVALSPRSAYAVGAANYDLTSIGKSRPTIEHWNGAIWGSLTKPGDDCCLPFAGVTQARDGGQGVRSLRRSMA